MVKDRKKATIVTQQTESYQTPFYEEEEELEFERGAAKANHNMDTLQTPGQMEADIDNTSNQDESACNIFAAINFHFIEERERRGSSHYVKSTTKRFKNASGAKGARPQSED
jgi:hypothetical protein